MDPKKSIVIANWKMKLGVHDSLRLASQLKAVSSLHAEIVVCPSFVSLFGVAEILKKSKVKVGAQDVFWQTSGTYTGEVSAEELKEVGCEYVLIGHSERRKILHETDQQVCQKIKAALGAGITPVVCVGETFEERERGAKDFILIEQLTKAFDGTTIDPSQQIVVAYEPVWAISPGRPIDPSEAELAQQVIHQTLIDLFPLEMVNNNMRIIYGGSVDPKNVNAFISLEHTAGVLVGSASLRAESFIELIQRV